MVKQGVFLAGQARVLFSCEFCEIPKNKFLQNTSGGYFWTSLKK